MIHRRQIVTGGAVTTRRRRALVDVDVTVAAVEARSTRAAMRVAMIRALAVVTQRR